MWHCCPPAAWTEPPPRRGQREVTSTDENDRRGKGARSPNHRDIAAPPELQGTNEEQLQAKISQLKATTNDLTNLLGSTDIAVIFLDAELRVRRFTPDINDLVELRDADLGRPLTDLAQKFTDDKLLPDARAVLQKLVPVEREVRSNSGRWYLRRTLPYRTAENHIEGVVVTFVDIAARKRAEDEILSTQVRLQAVLEQMPTAVVMVQAPNGRLLFANRKAGELFNNTFPTPVPGDPMPAFYPILAGRHMDGEAYRAEEWPLARVLAGHETINDQEVTVNTGDGRELALLMSAAPVRDADGKAVAVVGTFLDITQRKRGEHRLSQVEERFKLLVESAKDFAIFSVDTKGRVLTWSAGAERILGWPEQEIIGQWGAILFTPEDRAALIPEEELRQAEETGRANDERWHIRKDGTRFWASGVMAAVRGHDGEVEGFVKIMRDQTDRKLAEDRLLAATATAERAEAVAIEANRAKDDFIAVVSHELRTPLNTIRLWARMLRNEKLSAKDREEGIQMVERAAVAQQQVIDDLFDVSRIASGKLRLTMRPTRLGDAIRGAIEAVEPVATARGIRLSTDVSNDIGTVRADPGRIQQVVWNLLSNAVKFTPAGGKVHVAARRTGANVLIEVADTGIGIRPDFLEKIFERFRQVEIGSKRAHRGLGLGLSIARQLVELHEGTISARSEGEGKGSTFCVTLPLAPQEGLVDAPAAEFGKGSDLRGVDVLVVEDEGMTRDTMCRLLENAAAKVRAVDSVAAAREALEKRMPQLLLSDIAMPGEDGYELIRHLRSLPKTSHVITVAVTAFARPEDRRQVLEAGFDEHLSKPLDADQLLATLTRLVQRSPNA
jgi:two-component system, chemotaxis family, CheB/CheR fusion protein